MDISDVVSLTKSGTLESSCFLFYLPGVASYQQWPCDTFYTGFLPCAVIHPDAFTSHTCLCGPDRACRGWCGFRGLLTPLSVEHYQNAALWISSTLLPVRTAVLLLRAAQLTPRRARENTAGAQSHKLWFLAHWNKCCLKPSFLLQWLVLIKISQRKKKK